MSSEEEDTNPTQTNTQPVEQETTDLEVDNKDEEEYDEEEDKDLNQHEFAIKGQLTGITVKVDNPTKQSGGTFGKDYTAYDVIGSDKNGSFSVKRRYNEFFELKKKLTENWPGYFIPPIPEKQTTGNTASSFIAHRQEMLNHFMERCAKMQHIFYSEEMQTFLHSKSDKVSKSLQAIKCLSPSQVYERNKQLFPEYDKDLTDKVEKNVKRYFSILDSTMKFFSKFRSNAKNLMAFRANFKTLKTQFMKFAINDYKNKLKNKDDKKEADEKFRSYMKTEREDDLSRFVKKLKLLELDFTSFMNIKEDLKNIKNISEKTKKRQEEAQKNLAKVRSQESNEVKDGLFKKVSKTDRIAQLEKEIEECQKDIESLDKNRSFTFHLLNSHEFPILINDKRTTFAEGIIGFSNQRIDSLNKETELLTIMHEHYRKY